MGGPIWQRGRFWLWIGMLAWVVPLAAFTWSVLRRPPGDRSLDPIYRWGLEAWRVHLDLYSGYGGATFVSVFLLPYRKFLQIGSGLEYLYPPSFFTFYWPFAMLQPPWGEILWRWIGAAGMAWMLARLMRAQGRPWNHFDFLLLSIGVLPVSLGALQGGQANVIIAVCLLGAALAMTHGAFFRAGLWLAVGCGIKPFVIAPIGLACVLFPATLPGLVVGGLIVLGIPLLTAPSDYALDQYAQFVRNTLGPCMNTKIDRFADFNGLLRMMDSPLTGAASTAVRALAGALFALWMLRIRTRMPRPDLALVWVAASTCYLMLFNPLTEANSYCMLAVPMVLFAWRWIDAGKAALGWSLFLALIGMGVLSEMLRPINRNWGTAFDLRFMPLTASLFLLSVVMVGPPARDRPDRLPAA